MIKADISFKARATLIGCMALVMWVAESLVVCELSRVPLFQMLTMVFLISFSSTALRVTKSKKWHLMKQHWSVWLLGVCGVCGSDLAYIYATRASPIAHIDLIDYSWPCLIVFVSGLYFKEKISISSYIGAFLGLFSSYILVSKDFDFKGVHTEYIEGYIIAIMGAAAWAGYNILSRQNRSIPTEMVGLFSGFGAIIVASLHIITGETFIMPSMLDCLLSCILGMTGAGCAYQLWDYGVKFGNIGLLSSLTYFSRILSMSVLVYFGIEPFSVALVVACLVSTLSVYISSVDVSRYFNWRFYVRSAKEPKLEVQ